jgi:hypothetical protein
MTEKPQENTITIDVPERDKPFILAISSVILFAGEIGAAVYAAIAHPTADISVLKEAVLFTGGLVSTAWTYYLVKKNGKKE